MVTLKELEALCWVARLGSFERAAARLHTTQSAISKRLQVLQESLGVELFDRVGRRARLNAKGEEVRTLGEEMLGLRDRLVERASRREVTPRRLRIGITELTAMTWLPRLVQELRSSHPGLVIEPEVAPSGSLTESLLQDAFDLIVTPAVRSADALTVVHLADVENAWMCSPGLAPARQVLPLREISRFTLLTQGGASAVGPLVDRWLRANHVRVPRTVATNNLIALVGLTIAGLGVSYMPSACFEDLVQGGLLAVLRTSPALPKLTYVAAYRRDRASAFQGHVAAVCTRVCDFTRRYEHVPRAGRP